MKNVFLNVRTAKAQAEGCAKVNQMAKRMAKILTTLTLLLTLGVGQMWGSGGIGYKGVKFTKNGSATGWYNIHNVSWGYSDASYECRSGQSGVTDFNNANLGTVTTLKLKAFVVIGWCDGNDYVAGQLKYRLYKQSASAGSYSTYSVGNYGNNSGGAANVLVSSGKDRVVGNASLTTDIVTSSTAPGNYYLQLQGLGRMQWKDGGNSGSFSDNNGSEVKATLTVPGFTTTSTSNAYGNVNVGSNSSTTISFTQHYGTALTTSNCSLTNSTDFQVTGISETGVTVKFMPQTTGDKSCTLTITDANSKTCSISLTGTGTSASTATITYHENFRTETGNGTGSAPDEEVYALNATATVAGKNTLAFENYTFQGWNTEEHITGTSYAVGSSITMDEDKDLYAVWTRTIPLDDQGATTAVTGDVYGTYNSSSLPSFTNPEKTGYTFQGWYSQIGGGGSFVINTSRVFQPSKNHWTNASRQFIRPSTSTSSLYAKWTQTVSLKANTGNHGSGSDGSAIATWNGSVSVGTHCTPATGYKLEGYYTEATGGTKILNADGSFAAENITNYVTSSKWTKAGATTLYAQYVEKTKVRLYYSNPAKWSTVKAYVWNSSNTGDKNAEWSGVVITSNTVVRNGDTYYYYEYFKEDHPNWDRVIFNDGGSNQTNDITFSNTTNNGQYNDAGNRQDGSWHDMPAEETLYSVTFYAGDHGAINAKGTAIAKNGNASVNIGATARALTATPESGYSFDKWVTTGSVTVTDPYSASTTVSASAAGGTVTATYLQNSGWYLQGGFDNYDTWETTAKALPVDRPYRGISGVYYRPFSTLDNGDYFGLHDGTNKYSGHTATDKDYDYNSLDQVATLYVNSSKSFQAKTSFSNKWAVINTTGTKTFWIQDPQTYYSVNVTNEGSGSKGTYKVTLNSSSVAPSGLVGKEMTKFANGETFKITVTGVTGYIPTITIGSTPTTFNKEATTYEATGTMGTGDVAVTISYTASYTVELEVGTIKGNKHDPKIYLGSTDSEGNVVASGTKVKSGTKVIYWISNDKDNVVKNAHYTWWGFRDAPAGTDPTHYTDGRVSVYTVNALSESMHVYAVFGETNYWITSATTGQGSIDPEGANAHVQTATTFTANPSHGWKFYNWTIPANVTAYGAYTANSNPILINATAAATLTANFQPRWAVQGLDQDPWNPDDYQIDDTYYQEDGDWKGNIEISLAANTEYRFQIYDRKDGDSYGVPSAQSYDWIHYAESNDELALTKASGYKDLHLVTGAAGTYTFKWNETDKAIAVEYPTSWWITTGQKTEGQDDNAGGSFTAVDNGSRDVTGGKFVANGASVTFEATPNTGYNFDGWYTDEDCTEGKNTSNPMTISSITANKTIYAKFVPETYTVTLTRSGTGYGSGGDASATATFNAALPSATMPTAADGYAFMGYYTAADGEGSQIVAANGTWQNVAGYTSAGKWVRDAGIELFAYFKKAEITGITFSPAAVEPDEEVTATATISPTPTGTTMVCWEVRYASNNVLLDPQPTLTPSSGTSVTFTAPSAAVYKFIATLKTGNECSGGTVLDTENANLTVAGSHPVTIRYKHGDVVIKEETIQNIHATVATEISAPNIIGYSFSSWTLGDGITKVSGNLTDPSITVTAIYDGVITANYNPKRMIYFYNSLGWSSVNVYFYKNDSYWNNTYGTGANTGYTFTNTPYSEGKHGTMTRIDGTDIWYFDCEAAGVNASYDDVVFTELNQHGYGYFAKTDTKQNKVVRRGDYKSSMPMFVPVEQDGVSMNGGLAIYYNEGYWMNYPENTGYTVRIYNAWNADKASPAREYYFPYSSDKKMPLKLDVEFNTTDAKWFMIYRNDGVYLSVNAEMTQASHTNYRIKDSNDKIKIQPSAPGVYTYTLTYYDDEEKDGSGKAYGNMYHITVDYPVSVGDYRILYKDNATWSQGTAHTASWCHPSDAVNKISGEATEAKKDTVSLFVSYGASPTAKFQYVSAINASTGAVTWSDVDGGTISLSSITKSGTYNFIISQPVGGASVSVEKIEAYTGNYYIRTDCAGNTKWDSYRAADHQMTYSEFSCSEANSFGEKFSHYFTHWCPAGTNVKFVIANDYSSCISDTLIQDVDNPYANINSDGFLNSDGNPEETANRFSANIRFMYNEATNKISRAYVASSTNNARWFLVLRSNSVIQNESGAAIEDIGTGIPSVIMADKQNWIYEKTLKILPGSKFKLFACYAEVTPSQSGAQYFRGYWAEDDWANSANTIELVGGSGSYQKVRVLYDFKTNRLVCAWLPDGDVTGEMNINADVMIIREHQEDATMITFTNSSSKLEGVKTVYGAMKFNRWILNNKSTETGHAVLPVANQKSIFERALYFISFPFDVNLGEVFGFGTYGVHWIIENYDGENRAKNGYWIDSPPNWKYVTSPKGYTLKANKGYILCLDLDLMKDDNEEFWPHGIETVELFFPSAVAQSTIEQENVTIPAPDPAIYQCTINRGTPEGDRRIKDSYWRCLGVPSFANYTTTLSNGTSTITWQTGSTLPYLYAWNMENNTLTAQGTSTFAFKTMHAYLTQCSTAIVWTAASKPTPAAIARYSENDMLKDREFRLELVENGVKADQTYIRLSAKEDVTSGFEFGNDLSKEFNSGVSNIYTFIGYERAAANSLPLSTEQITIVPVGVVANAAGEYTFSMPDGTDGIGVTLIDEETGIRTNLSALDYTVDLSAGKHDSRFWLEISPVKGAETGMEEVTGDGLQVTGPRKVMIDGILYIVKDGKLFDARGARVE